MKFYITIAVLVLVYFAIIGTYSALHQPEVLSIPTPLYHF